MKLLLIYAMRALALIMTLSSLHGIDYAAQMPSVEQIMRDYGVSRTQATMLRADFEREAQRHAYLTSSTTPNTTQQKHTTLNSAAVCKTSDDTTENRAIAQEIKILCTANATYKSWLNADTTSRRTISQRLISETYQGHERETIQTISGHYEPLLPLTEIQAPELHKKLKKFCILFNMNLPIILLTPEWSHAVQPQKTNMVALSYTDLTDPSLLTLEYVIAHELTHIKENHLLPSKHSLFSQSTNENDAYWSFCRKNEEEADRKGLALLGSPEHYREVISLFKSGWRLSGYATVTSGSDTHPSHAERASYLEKDLAELEKVTAPPCSSKLEERSRNTCAHDIKKNQAKAYSTISNSVKTIIQRFFNPVSA